MAIDPLQRAFAPTPFGRPAGTGKEKVDRAGFEALLGALEEPAGADAPSRQAAAELFRIEMMQHSLALLGEPGAPVASGTSGIRSLLAALATDGVPGGLPVAERTDDRVPPPASAADRSAASAPDADLIGETAAHYLGMPYRFGGEGENGIDCSSFVQQVFREHHVDLPRTAREQIRIGEDVQLEDLKKGDLVFFQTYASYPSHVGIYLGDGKMIHASSGKGEVAISAIDSDYYRPRYLGAKRVA